MEKPRYRDPHRKKVVSITSQGITVEEEGKTEEIAEETIVLALGAKAENPLADVKGDNLKISVVGDCLEPRKILDAIYEGARVGCEI